MWCNSNITSNSRPPILVAIGMRSSRIPRRSNYKAEETQWLSSDCKSKCMQFSSITFKFILVFFICKNNRTITQHSKFSHFKECIQNKFIMTKSCKSAQKHRPVLKMVIKFVNKTVTWCKILQPDFEAAYQNLLKKSCFNLCYNDFVYLCYFCYKNSCYFEQKPAKLFSVRNVQFYFMISSYEALKCMKHFHNEQETWKHFHFELQRKYLITFQSNVFYGCLNEYDYLHNSMPVTMSSYHTKHGNTVWYWTI
jgi:hypothetical protein